MKDLNLMYLVPVFALALQGCVPTPAPADDWLAGSWVTKGESCESDAGIRFNADHTYGTFEDEGTWRLEGNEIVLHVTGTYDEDMNLKPSDKTQNIVITKRTEGSIAVTDLQDKSWSNEWERCPDVPADSPEPVDDDYQPVTQVIPDQQIIWQYTGGFTYQGVAPGAVNAQCVRIGENLDGLLAQGYKIQSSTPATRNVNSGVCQGRDIILEME